jgi:hypothetical protein
MHGWHAEEEYSSMLCCTLLYFALYIKQQHIYAVLLCRAPKIASHLLVLSVMAMFCCIHIQAAGESHDGLIGNSVPHI